MDTHRILLVEDDKDLSDMYGSVLRRAGFDVHICENGFDGISAALEFEPELILLDLMMPHSDGRDVLSLIRLNPSSQTIPVIILSNLNPDTIDLQEYQDQIMDYWVKAETPPSKLLEQVREYFA